LEAFFALTRSSSMATRLCITQVTISPVNVLGLNLALDSR